jgi:hypothetical protein
MNRNEREKREVHQFKKRAGWKDSHHLTPRSRGGEDIASNTSMLDGYRHDAYHLLFGTCTLAEARAVLQRWEEMKNNQRLTYRL